MPPQGNPALSAALVAAAATATATATATASMVMQENQQQQINVQMNGQYPPQMQQVLYTALNSPSLIFTLLRSETDSPSLEFALSPIV